ncbi:MAG TPA: Gfo/Idh/MocA family oxidoreductase [Solirubrobacteraceae bacterium]|nr:Gfo/Idh/MocA family oxidoreductase [Solirubrobacteraceae bacterium]
MRDIREIKAAVVGTGFIGVVHVEALRRLGVEVTGIVGSSPERAAEKARAAGLPAPYPSFEAMLADPAVEVVHLTTPNNLHHEQVRAVLAAGKHVVCEKPLAMNSEETGELLRLAEDSGLVHAVNFNIRFYAQNQAARARVQAGEIGDVRLISGGYLQDWLLYDTDWNWRLDPAEGGSLRAVGDIGSHWLDLVTFITGRHVEAVMADLTTFIGVRKQPTGPVETFTTSTGDTIDTPMETEDTAGILLRLSGGARAVVTVSQVSSGRKNRLSWEIDGSQAALAWHSEAPEELWIGHRDRPNELLLREAGDYPPGHAEGFPDTFKHLYRAVYGAVAAGGPPDEPDYPTFVDGHEEALIADAIAQSHAEQRWVNVAPVAVP